MYREYLKTADEGANSDALIIMFFKSNLKVSNSTIICQLYNDEH